MLATPTAAGVEIAGDDAHPSNYGRLCSKGSALGETLELGGRLLHPEIRKKRVSWDEALAFTATGLKAILDRHGPESVALYVSGQLLTEDYYVANKLVKGYFGTGNIDTNSRLCMASAVAGHKRAFGEDIVPVSYEDLEQADLVVLVGSNTAWCHPVVHQRLLKAREKSSAKLVVLDPRRTATCDQSDLHLPLKPGTDVWLFNGLLTFLHERSRMDAAFVGERTRGLDAALAAARASAPDVETVARICGVDVADLTRFYEWFASTEKVVTLFSQGVNQSSSGTDKVNAIINCHLLTGRIGQPGMGPFSITGQPNAMGGREVGGLATMLAAHLEFDATGQRIARSFWGSPRIATGPGPKAVEMFEQIHEGRIKAVWIMATNPVVSLPDADRVKAALARCELVVVSDCVQGTDTAAFAHVTLPALAWGEKDGTVTNSERRISRQRAFLPPPGEAKPDWWIVSEVAKRLGYGDAFNYTGAAQIFDEHARLSAHENDGTRGFDLGALAGMNDAQFDAMEPVRWGPPEMRFYHPDRRARFIATAPRAPENAPDDAFPLVLNTGRIRDQWHTMTRTGLSPRLAGHMPEPFAELHPHDALLYGVRDNELVRVSTRWGSMLARLRMSADQGRGSVFVPIHWNNQFSSDARVGALVNPVVDPVSGEPEFKHTPARIEPFAVDWHGFILSRRRLPIDGVTWWTRIQGQRFLRYEIAGRGKPPDWSAWARDLLGVRAADADWLDYLDAGAGTYRAAHLVNDAMQDCVFVSPRQDLPSRSWLSSLFAKERIEEIDRVGLLIGAPPNAQADPGPTVCSCYGVGRNVITRAIREQKLTTAAQVTSCLKAGGNCGSCLPEIRRLVAAGAGS